MQAAQFIYRSDFPWPTLAFLPGRQISPATQSNANFIASGIPPGTSTAKRAPPITFASAVSRFYQSDLRCEEHSGGSLTLDVPKGLIGLGGWMSTTPDGTPLLLRDLQAAEIYPVHVDLP